jgi:hypothetical protein
MIFAEMCIKTQNCRIVLLANYNAEVFKKAEYAVAVAKCKLPGPLIGVCGVAFAIVCVVYLLQCWCSAVPHKLHCADLSNIIGNSERRTINMVSTDCSTSWVDASLFFASQVLSFEHLESLD